MDLQQIEARLEAATLGPWRRPEWSEAAHEYELTRVAFEQLRESPWGWIMDRADRMEAKK